MADELKFCKRCSTEKPLSDFHRQHDGVKGRRHICKICANTYTAKWMKDESNKEKRKKHYRTQADKEGRIPADIYYKNMRDNAEGKQITNNRYAHRRRARTRTRDEFTEFVFGEAILLRDMRIDMTGIAWHIDHIIPLNGKNVCGLHTATNFQVVPAYWNMRKSNKEHTGAFING